MAATTTVLKLTQIQGVVKVHGANSESATIALATTLKKSTETVGTPAVNIRRLYWSTAGQIDITRNGEHIWHLTGNGDLDFHGFADNQENESDIVVSFSTTDGVVIVDCAKVSGYGSQQHQGANGDLG